MLVLAVDTSTEQSSVVLSEDDRELSAWQAVSHQDLCRRLASEIASVLGEAGRRPADLDLVAVGLGPGTFTGLRIGLATAKAIALARDLPLIGVSSFAAMAWQVRGHLSGLLCPALDARRGELYAAVYQVSGDRVARAAPEFVAPPAELVERLRALPEPVTLFGQIDRIPADEVHRALGERGAVWKDEVVLPHARAIAHLGRLHWRERGADDLASLHPIYVRRSYAEEHFDIDLGLR